MENNHDIDKKFNEASKDIDEPATFPGFDKVWAKVEEKLDKKEEKKRILPIWLPYGIAASLMIGVGGFYFLNKKVNITESEKPVIAHHKVIQKNITAPSGKIQKIDELVKSNIEKEISVPNPVVKLEDYAVNSVYIPSPPPVFDAAPQSISVPPSIAPYKIEDTLQQKNIEEVVVTAFGIKRAKKDIAYASQSVSSVEVVSKSNKSALHSLLEASDAESITPDNGVDPEVIGYNKSNVKRNIASVQKLGEKVGNKYFTNSLQGSVSGLTINMGSGKIDSNNAIVIRGVSSVKEDANPLYIINGDVSDVAKFKSLNPDSIDTMTVLKGEKATSIYGSKAVNGVIVVETKDTSKTKNLIEKKYLEKKEKP
ncbi:TonB-dependent receptor plug domain-containing protein [Chryseobacterium limigenitum]|uniref:TonB-dependent outer membrane receptor, SusC/RagA subfamily, signature region n=1 Tax=Chryseobacterium limigenitum TaxID=1612149 RepID=A0A1K2IQG7_9FLAO|nr:TonB-dependent receptor plug domain-containing protein [Chryseobacterium limigenitum]SFZ94685.1 TonB-dependent outer membrane receptor, SusC/RagA subfamily, signature region [Chryseobacterium limigenitum]